MSLAWKRRRQKSTKRRSGRARSRKSPRAGASNTDAGLTTKSVKETQMATQIVPQVVSFPIPQAEPITQFELGMVLSLRNRARQLEAQIADAEKTIRTRLEAGISVEAGEHTANLKESFRRNVAW